MKAELATYQRLAREKFDHDKAVAVDRDNDYDGLKRELAQPFVSGGGAYICSCAGGKDVEGSTNTILEFWTQHEDEIPCVRALHTHVAAHLIMQVYHAVHQGRVTRLCRQCASMLKEWTQKAAALAREGKG